MYVPNQYAVPAHDGVPNPWGPRVHNWKGGPLNEGSLFHGPIYTRPDFKFPWMMRPSLRGLGAETPPDIVSKALYATIYIELLRDFYPDLFAEYSELEAETSASSEEFVVRVGTCVEAEFPTIRDEPIDENDIILDAEFPRARMEQVLDCIKAGESKLGYLLPLVAAGILMIWLAKRD